MAANTAGIDPIANAISIRDAWERVEQIASERDAQNLYLRAVIADDEQLVQAVTIFAKQHDWDLTGDLDVKYGAEANTATDILMTLLRLASTAPEELQAAINFTDDKYTQQAINDVRAAKSNSVRTTIATVAAKYRDQIAALANTAQKRAGKYTPTLDLNDNTQVMRVGQAWQYVIAPLLDSGTNWRDVIPSLDVDGVLAMQKFGPSWIATHLPIAKRADEMALLQDTVAAQWPRVTSGDAKVNLTNAATTAAIAADADQLAATLGSIRTPQDAAMVQITVQRVAYAYGALTALQ
jgi:hypothetical protein